MLYINVITGEKRLGLDINYNVVINILSTNFVILLSNLEGELDVTTKLLMEMIILVCETNRIAVTNIVSHIP